MKYARHLWFLLFCRPSSLPTSILPYSQVRRLFVSSITWRKSVKDWTLEGLLYGFFIPPPHTQRKETTVQDTKSGRSVIKFCKSQLRTFRKCGKFSDLRFADPIFLLRYVICGHKFFCRLKTSANPLKLECPIQTCTTKISPKKPLENISWFCHKMAELLKSGVSSSLSYYEKFADSRMSPRICDFADLQKICMPGFARYEKKTILFFTFLLSSEAFIPYPLAF